MNNPKPFNIITPLNVGAIFYGNFHITGECEPDKDKPGEFIFTVETITHNDNNIFDLYQYDDAMRFGFSTDVNKAIIAHCESLFPVEQR